MTPRDVVQVCLDLDGLGGPVAMGTLRRQGTRSGELFSFEYEIPWLKRSDVFAFDPDLAPVAGPQYPPPEDRQPGSTASSFSGGWSSAS